MDGWMDGWMDVLPRLKFLGAIATFTHSYIFPYLDHLQPKSVYMQHVQGLNLNLWSISGLEPEMPVTVTQLLYQLLRIYKIYKIYTSKHLKRSDMFRS